MDPRAPPRRAGSPGRPGRPAPPDNVLRGPVASVALGAGALLAALTYYVTSVNSWRAEPLLRGEGVALSVFTFVLFMIFVIPNLVFDDGPLKGQAAATLVRVVNNFFGDFAMNGDVIKGNQGVVATRGSQLQGTTVTMNWAGVGNEAAVKELADELARLRGELRRVSDQSADHDAAIGAVAAAEGAARKGDGLRPWNS
jgi:hypothetical protein